MRPSLMCGMTLRQMPVAKSHKRAVPSDDTVTAIRPSASMATPFTGPLCPASTNTHSPRSSSQRRAVASEDAVTRMAPLFVTAISVSAPEWPCK
jgi:hypothetical protein